MINILGNISLGLAAVLYLFLPFIANPGPGRGESTMGTAFGIAFVLIPLWLFLATGLCVAAFNGGLDWITDSRGLQYLLIVVTCLSLLVVTWMSGAISNEPSDQVPWAAKPFLHWAIYVFPIVVLVVAVLAVNGSSKDGYSPLVLRVPLGVVGAASLLACAGMLGQWFLSSQEMHAKQVEGLISREDALKREDLVLIDALDAVNDLGRLLPLGNRYKDMEVRARAIAKIRSNPKLEEDLASMLSGRWSVEALIYLDAEDAPDNSKLAGPVRDAIVNTATFVRSLMHTETTIRPQDFEWETRLVLSAADKFGGYDVDLVPAVQEFRGAFDEPRRDSPKIEAAATVDRWLAKAVKQK